MTTLQDDATVLVDHPIGARGRLVVRLASADVRVLGGDTDRVTVRTPSGRPLPDRIVFETVDGALTIRERQGIDLTFGSGSRSVELEIESPAEAAVSIDTASGSVETRGLRGEQSYRTASGDLRLEDGAGRIDLNAVSGDAELELVGVADLGIRTVSGDVRVTGGSLASIRVSTTSGDVRLDSPLTGRSGNAIETLSGDVSILANAGIRVEARTVSGDLSSDLSNNLNGTKYWQGTTVSRRTLAASFKRRAPGAAELNLAKTLTQWAVTVPPARELMRFLKRTFSVTATAEAVNVLGRQDKDKIKGQTQITYKNDR